MTEDIDVLARQALGEPPEDPEARDRALASLRAQIAAPDFPPSDEGPSCLRAGR